MGDSRVETLVRLCREVLEQEDLAQIKALFLYGSSLTPLFRSDSDIDIALLDSEDSPLTWSEQARLMDSLERATGHVIDLRMLRDSSLSHQAHVLEHGRLIWARDEGEVDRYARTTLEAARQTRQVSEREWPRVLDRLAGLASR